MNTAIIVAAGSGKRFGGEIPKQFLEILGKPLLIHTLEKFESCPLIDEIILVLSSGELGRFADTVGEYDLSKLKKTVAGGANRAESVLKGLESVNDDPEGIIAVHDGARPLVTPEEISRTVIKAGETGAACLVAGVTDTIKEIRNGEIVQTVDRTDLRRALTPQCFRFDVLKRGFDENEIGENVTDECFLIEKLGIAVAAVEGSSKNLKITHEEDLKIAEILLKGMD